MKFNCGPTGREIRAAKKKYKENWHTWFAWFPVRVGDGKECRWLETVERRGKFSQNWGESCWEYEYKEIE